MTRRDTQIQYILTQMQKYSEEVANEHGLTLLTVMALQQKYESLQKELEKARTHQFDQFIEELNATMGYDEDLGGDATPVVRSFTLSVIEQVTVLVRDGYTDPYEILDRIVDPS